MRVLVLAALSLALAACGDANRYPESYKQNFVQTCQLNGSSGAHCLCVWDKVADEIPVAEFEAADAALQAGQSHPISQQILAFHASCRAAP